MQNLSDQIIIFGMSFHYNASPCSQEEAFVWGKGAERAISHIRAKMTDPDKLPCIGWCPMKDKGRYLTVFLTYDALFLGVYDLGSGIISKDLDVDTIKYQSNHYFSTIEETALCPGLRTVVPGLANAWMKELIGYRKTHPMIRGIKDRSHHRSIERAVDSLQALSSDLSSQQKNAKISSVISRLPKDVTTTIDQENDMAYISPQRAFSDIDFVLRLNMKDSEIKAYVNDEYVSSDDLRAQHIRAYDIANKVLAVCKGADLSRQSIRDIDRTR